jgi:glycosyltransferase involved in cell wall biosynthesis
MHIAIVTDAWHPQVNGVVRTLSTTVEVLKKRGHAVDVIHPGMFLGFNLGRVLQGLRLGLPFFIGRHLRGARAVHISTEGPLGWAAKRWCERNGVPYTTAYHTNFADYLNRKFKIPRSVANAQLRSFHAGARRVLVPTRSQIVKLEAMGFKNCHLWGRGVDERIFNPKLRAEDAEALVPLLGRERPWLLNVGRVSEEKNLEAFLALKLGGTKVVVGDGPDRARLAAAYPDAVFVGEKRGHDLAAFYRAADCFVFPSRFDTFGLVNIEAIACGTPVAAYPVTGPIDIVLNEVTGYLDENLSEAVLAALSLKPVQGYFSWQNATDQFIQGLAPRPKEALKAA